MRMILRLMQLVCTVIGLSGSVLTCEWTGFRLGRLNNESIRLLSEIGGYFPHRCTMERGEQLLPRDVYANAQDEEVSMVALETLGLVADLFSKDHNMVSCKECQWNSGKLKLFRNIIGRQVEKLTDCVGGTEAVTKTKGQLTSFFNRLSTVLAEKEHSTCAWEVVRAEIDLCLRELTKFLNSKIPRQQ